MVVIDLAARKVAGNVDFGKGVRPHLPVFGPENGMLYVSTELEKSLPSSIPNSENCRLGSDRTRAIAHVRDHA